jgi:hypothetical protein
VKTFVFSFVLANVTWAAPFTLDFSQVGGPSAVPGTVLATGLNFSYGLSVSPNGSLLFGQTTTTYPVGLLYGWGPQATGSAWQLPSLGNGSFGAPVQVGSNFAGVVTSVKALSDGVLVVDSGAGAAGGTGNRVMSFVSPGGTTIGSIDFTFPSGSTFNWEHSNGMSLVVPGANGSNTVYFMVGSQFDATKTASTVSISGMGLSNVTLNADSVYMMTVQSNSANSVQITSAPQQIATGLRNPYALAVDASGDLLIADNGIDGAHNPNEQGADTLKLIPANQIGQSIVDYGFPNFYIDFATGLPVNGDPNATLPLVAFTPVADSNGILQDSEGVSDMAYLAPNSLPFVGNQGGVILTFHGIFDAGGAANTQNAVLYYDFASGKYVPILDAGTPGVGHINGVAVIGTDLFLDDMSQNGEINGLNGLGEGVIYEFDLAQATPEPGTWLLVMSGLLIAVLRGKSKRLHKTLHKTM